MANINQNRINTILSAAIIAGINSNIVNIGLQIPNVSLDEDERSSLLSLDVDNKVAAEDAITELGISGSGIMPAFINPNFIQNDLTLFEQMDAIDAALDNLKRKVSDVKRIAGHEAYAATLTVYKIYEAANAAGIPGAKQAYDKLSARFKGQGMRTQNPKP